MLMTLYTQPNQSHTDVLVYRVYIVVACIVTFGMTLIW